MSDSIRNADQREQARDKASGRFGSYESSESEVSLGEIVQPGEVTKGYMGAPGWIGGKHDPGRDITEIAKDVRGDLRRAQQDGWVREDLSFSVRTERFSGGRALRVGIKGMSDDERLAYDSNPYDRTFNRRGKISPEAAEVRSRVEEIVGQYNRDESNSQVDYFDTDFHASVGFDSDDDALANTTERETKRLTNKVRDAGVRPGDPVPQDLAEEIDGMKARHQQARYDLDVSKARRLASWRVHWAADEAGEGSVEHTSARIREEVLNADLPQGWLSRATPTTGDYTDGDYEAATVYASLDRPHDDTLNDLRPSAVRLVAPGCSSGVEAIPVNTEGGEVALRPYTLGEDRQERYDEATSVNVSDLGPAVSQIAQRMESTRG